MPSPITRWNDAHTGQQFGDCEPEVGKPLWNWAAKTTTGFRRIIDARLALRRVARHCSTGYLELP